MSANHAPAPSHGVLSSGCPSGPVEVRDNNPSGRGSGPLLVGRGALSNWVPSSWRQVQLLGSLPLSPAACLQGFSRSRTTVTPAGTLGASPTVLPLGLGTCSPDTHMNSLRWASAGGQAWEVPPLVPV